jgi:hypothetical protein
MQPVSITGYFDVDAYFNPSPIPPSYLAGYNFPGDVKFWENFIAANGQSGDTLTFKADMLVQSNDDQIAYGFADTSNFVFEGETAGEAGNPNNVLDNSSPVSCPGGPCPPPEEVVPDIPPGLTLCTDPLVNQSFETVSPPTWVLNPSSGVGFNTSNAHTGIRKLKAPSDSGDLKPWFYQTFTMPDWIISSTTTIDLNLYKNIDNAGADEPNDEFYAAIVTTPSSNIATALATKITTPTLIANGVMGGGGYDPNDWNQVSVSLPVIDRGTLESYAGQELTLYIYNDNASNFLSCSGAGCGTRYYFDDVQLSPCTTQPLPDTINTRITGVVTLNYSDGTFEKVPYVKVWAYEVNGNAVYETFTLQNGEFNFYNLPATAAGTEYLIFAQYNLIDPYDETQIETLAADTSIILKSTNDNNNPVQTFLDLFTLAPQP